MEDFKKAEDALLSGIGWFGRRLFPTGRRRVGEYTRNAKKA